MREDSRLWPKEGSQVKPRAFPELKVWPWEMKDAKVASVHREGSLRKDSAPREGSRDLQSLTQVCSRILFPHVDKLPKSQRRSTQMEERIPSQGKNETQGRRFPSARMKKSTIYELSNNWIEKLIILHN